MITKAKRHKIYKDALKYYLKLCKRGLYLGLCGTITTISEYNVYSEGAMKKNFPEVYKHKPSKGLMVGGYWWRPREEDKRVKVFKEAIELTKPKKRKKTSKRPNNYGDVIMKTFKH